LRVGWKRAQGMKKQRSFLPWHINFSSQMPFLPLPKPLKFFYYPGIMRQVGCLLCCHRYSLFPCIARSCWQTKVLLSESALQNTSGRCPELRVAFTVLLRPVLPSSLCMRAIKRTFILFFFPGVFWLWPSYYFHHGKEVFLFFTLFSRVILFMRNCILFPLGSTCLRMGQVILFK
jgi:hypothetical protein